MPLAMRTLLGELYIFQPHNNDSNKKKYRDHKVEKYRRFIGSDHENRWNKTHDSKADKYHSFFPEPSKFRFYDCLIFIAAVDHVGEYTSDWEGMGKPGVTALGRKMVIWIRA
jgi:hypothetical protein